MREFYQKYKCSIIIPIVLLIGVNLLSLLLLLYNSGSDITVEFVIYIVSLLMIIYYVYKQNCNIKVVINLIRKKLK